MLGRFRPRSCLNTDGEGASQNEINEGFDKNHFQNGNKNTTRCKGKGIEGKEREGKGKGE